MGGHHYTEHWVGSVGCSVVVYHVLEIHCPSVGPVLGGLRVVGFFIW